MKIDIHHSSPFYEGFRAERVRSLFNCENGHEFQLSAELPIDEKAWSIGLVVGPSGSGKTSIGHKVFKHSALADMGNWPTDQPIIEAITPQLEPDEVTAALSAVGLGSVPAWMRPFHVLSNGEQFRANLARILCEFPDQVVIDEFTSVVDRQVAKVGAAAFAKSWRRKARATKRGQVVLLSCHYDIISWLQPDWIFDTRTNQFTWRCQRPRPKVELNIVETNWRYWPLFEPHHYLKLPNMIAATCYVGFVNDEPVAHVAISPRPGFKEVRAARFVVMPDWQGIGVGLKFLNAVCAEWRRGNNRWDKPMATTIQTCHPALAASLRRHPLWCQVSAKLVGGKAKRDLHRIKTQLSGHLRPIQGFRYIEGMT